MFHKYAIKIVIKYILYTLANQSNQSIEKLFKNIALKKLTLFRDFLGITYKNLDIKTQSDHNCI